MAIPPDRLVNVTAIAHEDSLLKTFVQEKIFLLHGINAPVGISLPLHYFVDDDPTTVSNEIVAVLIKQKETPPVVRTEKEHAGYAVTELESGKPEQFHVLFVNDGPGQGCVIEATVEVRYFFLRNDAAQVTTPSAYTNGL